VKFICFHIGNLCIAVSLAGCGPFVMEDDANSKKRMRELVEDGYIVFDKLGRWRSRAQAGVPVSGNDLAGHSARKRRHRDRLRSQARSRSLIKIRRAQRTTALSIVLHLTQRERNFPTTKKTI
jgi:hypothetical protein